MARLVGVPQGAEEERVQMKAQTEFPQEGIGREAGSRPRSVSVMTAEDNMKGRRTHRYLDRG